MKGYNVIAHMSINMLSHFGILEFSMIIGFISLNSFEFWKILAANFQISEILEIV